MDSNKLLWNFFFACYLILSSKLFYCLTQICHIFLISAWVFENCTIIYKNINSGSVDSDRLVNIRDLRFSIVGEVFLKSKEYFCLVKNININKKIYIIVRPSRHLEVSSLQKWKGSHKSKVIFPPSSPKTFLMTIK